VPVSPILNYGMQPPGTLVKKYDLTMRGDKNYATKRSLSESPSISLRIHGECVPLIAYVSRFCCCYQYVFVWVYSGMRPTGFCKKARR